MNEVLKFFVLFLWPFSCTVKPYLHYQSLTQKFWHKGRWQDRVTVSALLALVTLGDTAHVGYLHRHLRIIDCLMACTACLVCFISTAKKEEKKAIMGCASSRHITKLKQSIFAFRYLWIFVICVTSPNASRMSYSLCKVTDIFTKISATVNKSLLDLKRKYFLCNQVLTE
jgi:hypothetical protein